jgi:Na+/melibiose symporter-like transporter
MFALYLGWAMVGTPFYAWSGELSAQYHQRSRIQTFVQVAIASGYVLVLLIPAVLDQLGPRFAHQKVAAMGAFALVSLLPGLLTVLFGFREKSVPTASVAPPVAKSLVQVLTSPLVVRVMGSDFFVCLGQGVRTALFVFFVTAYMGLPAWGSLLYLLQFVFGVFAGPIWLRIGYRLGKHRTVIAGEITQILINLCLLLVGPGQFWPLIALTVAQGLSQGSGNLMLRPWCRISWTNGVCTPGWNNRDCCSRSSMSPAMPAQRRPSVSPIRSSPGSASILGTQTRLLRCKVLRCCLRSVRRSGTRFQLS